MIKGRLFISALMLFGFSGFVLCQAVALPDLDLANCSCVTGKLCFTIINRGPGPLPAGWHAFTDVFFNGVKQASIPLKNPPTSTTGGGIEKPGGTSTYLVALDITSPVVVDFFIDAGNEVRESNELNNHRKGCRLKPCGPVKLPDLTIASIGVDNKCNLMVVVKNLGPGMVPDTAWTVHAPDSPGVFIYVDGKSWGGASIWLFDPAKALQPAGGSATYTSKLNLMGRLANITVTVDQTSKIAEVNEANNKMSGRRGCIR